MGKVYNLISFNKEYLSGDNFTLDITNRAFRYGDGFFETMHANGLKVQFVDDHYNRIQKAASLLKIQLPDFFSLSFLEKQIAGLLTRMKLFQGVRVRLSIYRSAGGMFFSETNRGDVLIEAFYLSKGPYELNAEGITIGVFDEIPKDPTFFSSVKTMNSLPYVLAADYAKQNNVDDVLLINSKNEIVEATSSNFFALKEKEIYTPPLSSGCVAGIMRKQVLQAAAELGYGMKETTILPDDIIEMDELFLSNAVVGIKYISGFKKKRYYKRGSKKILAKINEVAFG